MGARKGWGMTCEPQQELLAETKRIVNTVLFSPCGSVWPGNPHLPLQCLICRAGDGTQRLMHTGQVHYDSATSQPICLVLV